MSLGFLTRWIQISGWAKRHPAYARGALQKRQCIAHFRMSWMGVRWAVQRCDSSSFFPPSTCQNVDFMVRTFRYIACCLYNLTKDTPWVSYSGFIYGVDILDYTILARYCSHRVPVSLCLRWPLGCPVDQCWYARPQLYFTCYLRPAGGRQSEKSNYTCCNDNIRVNLAQWCSTAPSSPWTCQVPVQWKLRACQNYVSPGQPTGSDTHQQSPLCAIFCTYMQNIDPA